MSYEQDFFSQRLIKQITVEVPLEISADGNGYKTISEDEVKKAIEYDIKSILLTNKGERFDKDFGVGIKARLFENFDSAPVASLRRDITKQIRTYMPWLSSFNTIVKENRENGMLFVEIKYKINEVGIVGHFKLSLDASSL